MSSLAGTLASAQPIHMYLGSCFEPSSSNTSGPILSTYSSFCLRMLLMSTLFKAYSEESLYFGILLTQRGFPRADPMADDSECTKSDGPEDFKDEPSVVKDEPDRNALVDVRNGATRKAHVAGKFIMVIRPKRRRREVGYICCLMWSC